MIHLNTYQSLTLYESLDNLSPIKTVCIIRQMYTLKLITKDIQVMHQIQVSFHQYIELQPTHATGNIKSSLLSVVLKLHSKTGSIQVQIFMMFSSTS